MLDLAKVSVVVPVYNVEDYLAECLDSLVAQTLDDIEIICVNDGSTDNSLEILNKYQKDDDRIVIINQENHGLGAARNAGLNRSNGEYVYFIDSDDYLIPNALEDLYASADEKSLDLIIFKLINFYDETGEKFQTPYYDMTFLKDSVSDSVFNFRDIKDILFKISVSAPGKFFRRDLISHMRFPEGIIFEDNPFFIEAIFKADRVYFYDEYLYERRIRENSITTAQGVKNEDILEISDMLIDITQKSGHYPEFRQGLFSKILTNIYLRFAQIDEKYKEDFFSKIKQYFLDKKPDYDADEVFQNLDDRLKEIFYSAIESQNSREYELSVRCIDLDRTVHRRDEELEMKNERIREINTQKLQLINNSRRLSDKLNDTAYKNRQLRKDLKRYKDDYNDLKQVNHQLMNSTSWKVTKPMRFVSKKVR